MGIHNGKISTELDALPPTRSRSIVLRIVAIAIVMVCGLYAALGYYFAHQLVTTPGRSLEQDRHNLGIEGPGDFSLPVPEEVHIVSDIGPLVGWIFRQEALPPGQEPCAAIGLHGYSGTRYGAFRYGGIFWRRGCHLLTMDLRSHGESAGDALTYGYFEKYDLVAVTDWLSKELSLDRNRIALVGESLGAAVSIEAAALMPDIAMVVADSPYADLLDITARTGASMYGQTIADVFAFAAVTMGGWQTGADLLQVSPETTARTLRVPVLLIHSQADEFTPPAHSQRIFAALPHERKALHLTEWGAPHARSYDANPKTYQRYVNQFIDRELPGFGITAQ